VIRILAIVPVLATLLLSSVVNAQAFVPNLPPGSTYHLAFVTDGTRYTTSNQIDDYDAFVNADAATNSDLVDINWLALASTPDVDAIDHVPIGGPIYRLDGMLIAVGSDDLWDGTIENPFFVPQSYVPFVWTGTDVGGSEAEGSSVGSFCGLGRPAGECGLVGPYAALGWPENSEFWAMRWHSRTSIEAPLYAVSEPLAVPIPEPSGFVLLLLGFGLVWCKRRRRR
jgi:hypothetical protein